MLHQTLTSHFAEAFSPAGGITEILRATFKSFGSSERQGASTKCQTCFYWEKERVHYIYIYIYIYISLATFFYRNTVFSELYRYDFDSWEIVLVVLREK